MDFIKRNKKELIIAAILLVLAIISEFVLGKIFSDPNTYAWCYSTLDQKKTEVMTLTALIAGTSAAISAIPGDAGLALASQLANLSTYLLIILTFVYLEKYTLTVIGVLVFRIIVPIILIFYIIVQFNKYNYALRSIANKLLVFSIVLILLVPSSVYVSNMIQNTYNATVGKAELDETIVEEIEVIEESQEQQIVTEKSNENKNALGQLWDATKQKFAEIGEKGQEVIENIKSGATDAIDKLKDQLGVWIEQIAIMIVTSCIIPIITLIFFLWITKLIFNYQGKTPSLIDIKNKTMDYVDNITHNKNQKETKQIETKDISNNQ